MRAGDEGSDSSSPQEDYRFLSDPATAKAFVEDPESTRLLREKYAKPGFRRGWRLIAASLALCADVTIQVLRAGNGGEIPTEWTNLRQPGTSETGFCDLDVLKSVDKEGGFVGHDLAKGFGQLSIDPALRTITPQTYREAVISPERVFLGIEWAPRTFQLYTTATFATLRMPDWTDLIPILKDHVGTEVAPLADELSSRLGCEVFSSKTYRTGTTFGTEDGRSDAVFAGHEIDKPLVAGDDPDFAPSPSQYAAELSLLYSEPVRGRTFCLPYIDDVNVRFGDGLQLILLHACLFMRARAYNWSWGVHKLTIKTQLFVLGWIVDHRRKCRVPDPHKTTGLSGPLPTTARELQHAALSLAFTGRETVATFCDHLSLLSKYFTDFRGFSKDKAAQQAWVEVVRAAALRVEISVLQIESAANWRTTGGLAMILCDSSLIRTRIWISQRQWIEGRFEIRLVWVSGVTHSKDAMARMTTSSIAIEVEGLYILCVTVLPKMPLSAFGLAIDNQQILTEESLLILLRNPILCRSVSRRILRIAEITGSFDVLWIYIRGATTPADLDTKASRAPGTPPPGVPTYEELVKGLEACFGPQKLNIPQPQTILQSLRRIALVASAPPTIDKIEFPASSTCEICLVALGLEPTGGPFSIDVGFSNPQLLAVHPVVATSEQLCAGVRITILNTSCKMSRCKPTFVIHDLGFSAGRKAKLVKDPLLAATMVNPDSEDSPSQQVFRRMSSLFVEEDLRAGTAVDLDEDGSHTSGSRPGSRGETLSASVSTDPESIRMGDEEAVRRRHAAENPMSDAQYSEVLKDFLWRAVAGHKLRSLYVTKLILIKVALVLDCFWTPGRSFTGTGMRVGHAVLAEAERPKEKPPGKFTLPQPQDRWIQFLMWESNADGTSVPYNLSAWGLPELTTILFLQHRSKSKLGRIVAAAGQLNRWWRRSCWPPVLISEVWSDLLTTYRSYDAEQKAIGDKSDIPVLNAVDRLRRIASIYEDLHSQDFRQARLNQARQIAESDESNLVFRAVSPFADTFGGDQTEVLGRTTPGDEGFVRPKPTSPPPVAQLVAATHFPRTLHLVVGRKCDMRGDNVELRADGRIIRQIKARVALVKGGEVVKNWCRDRAIRAAWELLGSTKPKVGEEYRVYHMLPLQSFWTKVEETAEDGVSYSSSLRIEKNALPSGVETTDFFADIGIRLNCIGKTNADWWLYRAVSSAGDIPAPAAAPPPAVVPPIPLPLPALVPEGLVDVGAEADAPVNDDVVDVDGEESGALTTSRGKVAEHLLAEIDVNNTSASIQISEEALPTFQAYLEVASPKLGLRIANRLIGCVYGISSCSARKSIVSTGGGGTIVHILLFAILPGQDGAAPTLHFTRAGLSNFLPQVLSEDSVRIPRGTRQNLLVIFLTKREQGVVVADQSFLDVIRETQDTEFTWAKAALSQPSLPDDVVISKIQSTISKTQPCSIKKARRLFCELASWKLEGGYLFRWETVRWAVILPSCRAKKPFIYKGVHHNSDDSVLTAAVLWSHTGGHTRGIHHKPTAMLDLLASENLCPFPAALLLSRCEGCYQHCLVCQVAAPVPTIAPSSAKKERYQAGQCWFVDYLDISESSMTSFVKLAHISDGDSLLPRGLPLRLGDGVEQFAEFVVDCCDHGLERPPILRGDQEFKIAFATALRHFSEEKLDSHEFTLHNSATYSPWSNFPVESGHKEINRVERLGQVSEALAKNGHDEDWTRRKASTLLHLALSSVRSWGGVCSMQIDRGRRLHQEGEPTDPEELAFHRTSVRCAASDARERSRASRQPSKLSAPYVAGDVVLRSNPKRTKQGPQWLPTIFWVTGGFEGSSSIERIDGRPSALSNPVTNSMLKPFSIVAAGLWGFLSHLPAAPRLERIKQLAEGDVAAAKLIIENPDEYKRLVRIHEQNDGFMNNRLCFGDWEGGVGTTSTTSFPDIRLSRQYYPLSTNHPAVLRAVCSTRPWSPPLASWNLDGVIAAWTRGTILIFRRVANDSIPIICLQETKLSLQKFQKAAQLVSALLPGWHFVVSSGIKDGYAGVGFLIRDDYMASTTMWSPRCNGATSIREGGLVCLCWEAPNGRRHHVLNTYVTNAGRNMERLAEKETFLRDLGKVVRRVRASLREGDTLRLVGDMNAVKSESDMHPAHVQVRECWPSTTTAEERIQVQFCKELDLVSVRRQAQAGGPLFTFYPTAGDRKAGRGINLDDILVPSDQASLFSVRIVNTERYDHQLLVS